MLFRSNVKDAKRKISAIINSKVDPKQVGIKNGDLVIAAITSCTNTSNPSVIIGAGLIAKKAVELGLTPKPWVKSSLAPGSRTVTTYLEQSDLLKYLQILNFNTVGYGCTTCIGNSGPLKQEIEAEIKNNNLNVAAILSGNRNFEGRIHPLVKMNFLASPMLVMIYALRGSILFNPFEEPIGKGKNGTPIFMKDIWPTNFEIEDTVTNKVTRNIFSSNYKNVFMGDANWQKLASPKGDHFVWKDGSTYIRKPPFFSSIPTDTPKKYDISNARILVYLDDNTTTDHISPAGAIQKDSPAGEYLSGMGIEKKMFNSYGSRRGNHEVMVRGTFANIRLRNKITPEKEGGYTKYYPSDQITSIYEASCLYQKDGTSLAVIAGKNYGSGSSRDWAAKGAALLGIKVVIAESYERIHRSNLVGMGILPLQFPDNVTAQTLNLQGSEIIDVDSFAENTKKTEVTILDSSSKKKITSFTAQIRIDTHNEWQYFKYEGILNFVLHNIELQIKPSAKQK